MTILGALAHRPSNAIQVTPWGDWSDSGSWSGKAVSNQTALQLLTVYGCNRFICDGISTLPVDVYRRRTDGSPVPVRTPQLIERPTPDLDFTSWATQVLTSLLMAGNFYGLKSYTGAEVTAVLPVDPAQVTIQRERGRKSYVVNGERFSSLDILHIPGVMWPGADVGMSPLEAARQTIGQGMSAQEFGAKFFGQGATLSGVIEVPGELDPGKAKEMAASWNKKHGGSSKSNLPGVLQGGAVWKPTGVTNEQSQFLETRKFTAAEICSQMFQIDPAEMGLPVEGSSLTYANLEQRNARKVQVTFLPWITRLEHALSALLPGKQYVKLNVNGLLRGDTKTRFDAYAVGITNHFLTPNEARDFEDWQPLPGGDEFEDDSSEPDTTPEDEPSMTAEERAGIIAELTYRSMGELADRVPTVNVHTPRVTVEPAVVNVAPAVVNVEAAEAPVVNVPETQPPVINVNIEPTPVNVEAPTVNVEAPTVNVEAPAVSVTNDVQPADVTVMDTPRSKMVVRDQYGNITRIIEE